LKISKRKIYIGLRCLEFVSSDGKVKDKGVKGKGDNCFALNLLADLRLVQYSTVNPDVI
jgi:hypothetical protein